jgi:RNA polymerase sigma factor (sigma-70 family)
MVRALLVHNFTEEQMTQHYREEFSAALFAKKRHPMLDPGDVERLFLEVNGENPKLRAAAIENIALANIGLVINLAKRYVARGLPLVDLVQEGLIQLVTKIIPHFDFSRGYKFSTYAVFGLRRAFSMACAEKGEGKPYYLPAHVRYKENMVALAQSEFIATIGRRPDAEEIHALLQTHESDIIKKLSVDAIDGIINSSHRVVFSLSRPAYEFNETSIEEILLVNYNAHEADNAVMASEQFRIWSTRLDEELPRMKAKERETIINRFGLANGVPRTLETVGELYGLTRERIRQIERSAIRRIAKRWRLTPEATREALSSLCEMGFRTRLQNNPRLKTKTPSAREASRVLSEHAVVLRDGTYVVKPARTLAARMGIDEETARMAVEACAKQGSFKFVDGCDAVRL